MNQQQVGQIVGLIQSIKNPNQVLENIIKSNPNANVAINQMRQSGMSAKDYVINLAMQNNIQLQPILSALQQVGIKL